VPSVYTTAQGYHVCASQRAFVPREAQEYCELREYVWLKKRRGAVGGECGLMVGAWEKVECFFMQYHDRYRYFYLIVGIEHILALSMTLIS
jgi:hypothetical protein